MIVTVLYSVISDQKGALNYAKLINFVDGLQLTSEKVNKSVDQPDNIRNLTFQFHQFRYNNSVTYHYACVITRC